MIRFSLLCTWAAKLRTGFPMEAPASHHQGNGVRYGTRWRRKLRDLDQDRTETTPRRSFFGIAAVSALGLFGLATSTARAQPAQGDGPDWPGTLKGRHKQLFDVYSIKRSR